MKIMKCDICGAEMDKWTDVEIDYKNGQIENKKICINCYKKIFKKIMQFFDKGKVE